jgi:hypothetical protein
MSEMKTQAEQFEFSVYCWDGWQRGHLGDFKSRSVATRFAKREAKTGLLGDIYYVESHPNRRLVAEFESGCV